jgi:choline kinase
MKAVILAAGIGSRLRPLTDSVPKCLVEVNQISILERQIEAFNKADIEEIIIICGYLADKISKVIDEKGYRNIRLINNVDYLTTNNMYSLYLAREYVPQSFILANADVIFHSGIIQELTSCGLNNVIVSEKNSYNEESMKIIVNRENVITSINKGIKPDDAYGNSIDVYKFSKEARDILFNKISDYIEVKKDKNSWTEVAINEILPLADFKPLDISNKYYWIEIDNFNDLEEAKKILNQEACCNG